MATSSTDAARIRKLASEIAKREGKKSNSKVGDIREIIGILADIIEEIPPKDLGSPRDILRVLVRYGRARAKKRKKP